MDRGTKFNLLLVVQLFNQVHQVPLNHGHLRRLLEEHPAALRVDGQHPKGSVGLDLEHLGNKLVEGEAFVTELVGDGSEEAEVDFLLEEDVADFAIDLDNRYRVLICIDKGILKLRKRRLDVFLSIIDSSSESCSILSLSLKRS
jgi:hypothetical protein